MLIASTVRHVDGAVAAWHVDGAAAARHVDGAATAWHVEVDVLSPVHARGGIRDGGVFCSLRPALAFRLRLLPRRLQIALGIAPRLQRV